MKLHTWLGTALALLPTVSLAAHDVAVDVRVRGVVEGEAWIEFRPSRSSFVALYAAFSDGTLLPVFPERSSSHWVDACDVRVVPVHTPCGVHIESVQAVASLEWFDPAVCWVAWAPPCDTYDRGVIVTTSAPVALVGWSFDLSWRSRSRCATVVRSCSWSPRRSCSANVVARPVYPWGVPRWATRSKADGPRNYHDGHGSSRSVGSSGQGPGKAGKVKEVLVASSGKETSIRPGKSGEPKRRSRR